MIEDLLAAGLKENADISRFSDIERRLKKDHRALVMYNAVAVDIGMKKHAESDLLAVGISELTNLEKRIKEGIKLSQDYARHKIMLAVAKKQLKQIGELNHNYSALLVETANRLYAEFSAAHGKMKKLSDAGAVRAKRNHLKHLADLYGEMSLLAEPRRVKLGDMPDVIGIFVRNSYTIKKLEKERGNVLLVRKELESLDLNNRTSRKQLKDCSKKLKGLPEKFARVEYYEGRIETEGLMQQIDYLRSSKAHSVWADLCRYVDALRTDIQHIAHETDLDKLRKLSTGLDSQEYDIYSGVISFKGKIQEYKELVQQFYDAVDGRIKKDDAEEKEQLRCQVNEAQRYAVGEARNAVKIEKQLSEEKNAVEGMLVEEKLQKEKEIDDKNKRIKAEQVRYENREKQFYNTISTRLDDLDKRIKKQNSSAYSDLSGQISVLKKQLSEYKSIQGEEKENAEKKIEQMVAELYEKFNTCENDRNAEQKKSLEKIDTKLGELDGKFDFYGKKQDSFVDDIVARVVGEFDKRNKKELEEKIDYANTCREEEFVTQNKTPVSTSETSDDNYFAITGDYVNPADDVMLCYRTFGEILADSSCWTNRLNRFKQELDCIQITNASEQDIRYLRHLESGLKKSFKSGELCDIAETSIQRRKLVSETITSFGCFIENLEKYNAA